MYFAKPNYHALKLICIYILYNKDECIYRGGSDGPASPAKARPLFLLYSIEYYFYHL